MRWMLTDRKGDDAKRPPECKHKDRYGTCPHLQETSSRFDFEGETYDCFICGEHFRLFYDEMR